MVTQVKRGVETPRQRSVRPPTLRANPVRWTARLWDFVS